MWKSPQDELRGVSPHPVEVRRNRCYTVWFVCRMEDVESKLYRPKSYLVPLLCVLCFRPKNVKVKEKENVFDVEKLLTWCVQNPAQDLLSIREILLVLSAMPMQDFKTKETIVFRKCDWYVITLRVWSPRKALTKGFEHLCEWCHCVALRETGY